MAEDIITKYKSQPAVVLLHQIPSLVWSYCILKQMDPAVRTMRPGLHRVAGYAVFGSSFAMVTGVWVMHVRHLIDELTTNGMGYAAYLSATSAWLIFTAVRSALAARAHDYGNHQAWVLRHVAAGMFVVTQRILMGIGYIMGLLGVVDWSQSNELRLAWFKICAVAGWGICFLTVEGVLLKHRLGIGRLHSTKAN